MKSKIENIFIIGGGQIYQQAIRLPECEKVYLTVVEDETQCDTFFPEIPSIFSQTVSVMIMIIFEEDCWLGRFNI